MDSMVAGHTIIDERPWEEPEDSGAWRVARRHSRWVRLLRLGLPITTVAIVLALIVSFQTLPTRVGQLSLGDVGVSGSTVTMQNPNLTGFGDNGQYYEVDAERAVQEIGDTDVVRLDGVSGLMRQEDGGWTTLEARDGLYNSEAKTLNLENDIVLRTHDGRRAYFETADVDMEAQTVRSDRPVRLEMPAGRVRADTLEVLEGGDVINLRGSVRVDLRLDGGLNAEASDDQG